MEITIKVGTMPQHLMQVKSKQHLPKIGDIIWVRKANTNLPWERVMIDRIENLRGWIVYFAARW